MTIRTRRIVICIGATVLLVVSAIPLFYGGLYLWALADRLFPAGTPGQNLNTSARDLYLSLSFFGLGLATVLSFVYCLWFRRPTKTSVITTYFVFLITVTSMSASNFAFGDALLNRKAQAFIDLILVTLGMIVVAEKLVENVAAQFQVLVHLDVDQCAVDEDVSVRATDQLGCRAKGRIEHACPLRAKVVGPDERKHVTRKATAEAAAIAAIRVHGHDRRSRARCAIRY